ncbi:MAG: hypothetical protein M3203_09040, partial [Actinomycetota bacterium]|nr:hypothetical protein [Actinomycetota bacterium]
MDDDDAPRSPSMNDSTKTTIAVLVALVAVLIVAGIGVATVRDATETLRKATATTATTAPGRATPAGADLAAEQARAVEEMKAQVAEIRGLPWKASLPIRVLSQEELAQRVRELNAKDIAENRAEIEAEEAVLKLLKLIPKDLDYVKAIDDLLAGLVVGLYDDETKELFVSGRSGPPDAATRAVLAHELTHALTDQHFEFGPRIKALDDEDRAEEAFAFTALVEGDANLVEELWKERHLTDRERLQAASAGSEAAGRALAQAPRYILSSLRFPYEEGLTFVRTLHGAGGFAEVDNAYRRPPTSTEHILHPETYVSGQGWAAPPLPDLAAATGCGKVDAGTLGEFDMTELLAEEINRGDARKAAAGWNGDAYAVVRCGTALGLANRWQADDAGEAGELADALIRWARGWSGSSR